MVKKLMAMLSAGLLILVMGGCAAPARADAEYEPEILSEVLAPGLDEEQTVMCSIRVTAGDTILDGVLYDNPTAHGFAEMLPLTADLWHPAPDFARAIDLPGQIAEKGSPGYAYEPGSLAYWDAGPSIALIYKASREETVVPVVPAGRITSDTSVFEEYGEAVTIEIIDMKTELSSEFVEGTTAASIAGTESGETMYTANIKVWDVINDPVFGDYGRLIFPADKSINQNLTLREVGNILTWYSYVNPDRTVEIANYMKTQASSGKQIFYDIYTEEEKAADPEKNDTGLFFSGERPGRNLPSPMPAADLPMWQACMTAFRMRWSCQKRDTMPLR